MSSSPRVALCKPPAEDNNEVLRATGVLPGVVYRHLRHDVLRRYWHRSVIESRLSSGERETLAELRDAGRRENWLYGRLLVKQLVAEYLVTLPAGEAEFPPSCVQPSCIEICSRDGLGRGIQPRIIVAGRMLEYSVSIAHSPHSVLVALSLVPHRCLGVDVTPLEQQRKSFSLLWLTPREQAWAAVAGERYLISKLWAVKEAFYKACNSGQPFVPGRIEVRGQDSNELSVWIDGRQPQPACAIHVMKTAGEVLAIVTAEKGHQVL